MDSADLGLPTPPPPRPTNLRIPWILRILRVQVHDEEIVPMLASTTSSSVCDLESKGKEAKSKVQHNMLWCGEN